MRFEIERDEAAFYGPKIDVQVLDAAGRESTLSTVQVDGHMPRQFDLSYVAADQSSQRPVMIHRSILGSLERLVAHLTEVYGGALPPWLAPVQVAVLPLTDQQGATAARFADRCAQNGLRAVVADPDRGTLGARIRAHRLVPYQAVIGPREVEGDAVSLRLRSGEQVELTPSHEALAHITDTVVRRILVR